MNTTQAPEQTPTLRKGDVLRYASDKGSHCREELAVVEQTDRGLKAYDTYWTADRSVLSKNELKNAFVVFNLQDMREVGRDEQTKYAEEDRYELTRQHGLIRRYFVRADAHEDTETILANSRYTLFDTSRTIESKIDDMSRQARDIIALAPDMSSSDLVGPCSMYTISDVASYCDAHLCPTTTDQDECARRVDMIALIDSERQEV